MTTRRHEAPLPSWIDIVDPHKDIAQGNLALDTYAVNLSMAGTHQRGVRKVYDDARAFFEATYLTRELQGILRDVLSALSGKSGNRVFQLRTPFGGGKTHTLLALYHLAQARHELRGIEELDKLPDPGHTRVVILSGLERGAADTHLPYNTLWGELAWKLGGPELYHTIDQQDRHGIAPGGDVLQTLIGEQPTLLLLDELLVYVENAMGVQVSDSTLGRQTLTFLHRLTEVVAASPHAAMVYSLQASEQEAGGNQELLGILSKLVQRVNAIREPVSGDEVMRVVQRRLFNGLGDEDIHRKVAEAYAENYRSFLQAGGIGLAEAEKRSEQLQERILQSYPFHPALLDLMRERWSSLPSYQRTRGALQFLATVVHAFLTEARKSLPLLGPGDIPMRNGEARTSFLSQVGEQHQYDAVLQADLFGPSAGSVIVDTLMSQDSPQLHTYQPGTRIATAALLYSFGGSSHEERGVVESDLLGACLAPNLDRNILQTALHDLNDRLLYLHRRDNRYRFETQPNLNKMIIDEKQKRNDEEVEIRLRKEFSAAIGNVREAMVWPKDTDEVKDRLPEFQIVYLSPAWLDAHSDPKEHEKELRRYIEWHGNIQRRYRNGLTLAVPDSTMLSTARNAVRMLITLEILKELRYQYQLTDQQVADLSARHKAASGELDGAFSLMYPIVYTPQYKREQDDVPYLLEPLTVQSYSQQKQLHQRIKEALTNRVVYDSVQPSKLATLTNLDNAPLLEQQFYPVTALTASFFSYFNWTHIWNEKVLREAIAIGVKNGSYGYVANAKENSEKKLVLGGAAQATVYYSKEIRSHEIDMGEGAYLLSATLAQQLLTPVAPKPVAPVVTEAGTDISIMDAAPGHHTPSGYTTEIVSPTKTLHDQTTVISSPIKPVAPGQKGQRYRLGLSSKGDQVFEIIKALEKLSDLSAVMEITLVATAKPGQPFDRTQIHNLIVEPMTEESDVIIRVEQVEE